MLVSALVTHQARDVVVAVTDPVTWLQTLGALRRFPLFLGLSLWYRRAVKPPTFTDLSRGLAGTSM